MSFYEKVPKDLLSNIRYRRGILQMAGNDPLLQEDLWIRCSRDILYFFNVFLYTYDPRKVESPAIPFVTYGFQDRAILTMSENLGKADVLVEKSRDMGASWICIGVIFHRWLFFGLQSFLLGSRKEEYVDKTGDMKGLFQKIDFAIKYLPGWMTPNFERTKLHLLNGLNGSSIDGESTNSNFARGGRWTAILKDEFAYVDNDYEVESASRDATNCRIYNSTPNGVHKVFYEKREKLAREAPERLIRLHWSEHPEKAEGLYISRDGVLELLDKEYVHEPDYPFILDGKMRSVWYDTQCQRAANEQEIGQEIDIDYKKSGFQFFDPMKLDTIIRTTAIEPFFVGDVSFEVDLSGGKLYPDEGGRLKLWIKPDLDGKFPEGRYVIGADIATGKGGSMSSNSVASIVDSLTGEKVGEFAHNKTNPTEFAEVVIVLCKMFQDAYLIWEDNGFGGTFGKRVVEAGYTNIYYRRNEASKKAKRSDIPGWYTTKDLKKSMLSEYSRALVSGDFINRSVEALKECGEYIHDPAKGIIHSKSMNRTDPTITGENHGDRVIADALAHRGRKGASFVTVKKPAEPPVGSIGYRIKQRQKKSTSGWVD